MSLESACILSSRDLVKKKTRQLIKYIEASVKGLASFMARLCPTANRNIHQSEASRTLPLVATLFSLSFLLDVRGQSYDDVNSRLQR